MIWRQIDSDNWESECARFQIMYDNGLNRYAVLEDESGFGMYQVGLDFPTLETAQIACASGYPVLEDPHAS